MTLLQELVNYCVTAGVLTADGEDAFRDFLPDAPDNVVAFIEYSGDDVNNYTTALHRSVQVLARAKSSTAARSKAVAVFNLLRPSSDSRRVDFSSTSWGQVYIRQTPFKLKQDESNRTIYCFNLGITTNNVE